MIDDKNFARLVNKLQVPVIISDILGGQESLSDNTRFALHEMLSELQPEEILLSIAISAQKIANIYHQASPSMDIINIECKKIIEDYAPLWLNNDEMNAENAIDRLTTITEDLECLIELLTLNISFLRAKDKTAAAIMEILKIQAGAGAMIAETALQSFEAEPHSVNSTNPKTAAHSNIVAFPGAA